MHTIAELARMQFVIRGRPGHNDRPALPPGHPATWGAITDGTVLDGAEYPIPPFLPKRDDAAHREQLAAMVRESMHRSETHHR